jgi:hypothetical protein
MPEHVPNGKLFAVPSQIEVETRFVLQRDEFVKAHTVAVRNLSKEIRWAGRAQFALLFALWVMGLAYRPGGELSPVSLVIVLLVTLVFSNSVIAQRATINLQFARMAGTEIWYRFDEMGFRSGMPNGESRVAWPGISKVIETDTLFVIMESGVLFHTVPKRAFAADGLRSLQQLVTEKVPALIK